jgi:hypothetical protein
MMTIRNVEDAYQIALMDKEKLARKQGQRSRGKAVAQDRVQNPKDVDTERGVNQYQVQFKTFFNLYLNHSTISNEQ